MLLTKDNLKNPYTCAQNLWLIPLPMELPFSSKTLLLPCRGGKFVFSFQVSPLYPHDASKVKCKTKAWMRCLVLPSISLNDSTCLRHCDHTELVCCLQVYHPNIDLEGNVCLNILREDWTPILNINIIIHRLFYLFTVSTLQLTLSHHLAQKKQDPLMTCDLECLNVQQPNHEDPLNSDAANVLRDDPDEFKSNAKRAMSGGSVGDVHFSSCLT